MKKYGRKYGLTITILFAIIIFVIVFISTAITGILAYSVMGTGIFLEQIIEPNIAIRIIAVITMISLTVGAAMAFVGSKIIANPADRLVAQMNRLASGDFKTRLEFGEPIKNIHVVSSITDSFNRMASELENTEMLRNDFINNFSHEFKTPIVSIAGFAKLLKYGNLSDKQKIEYLAVIEEESIRLADMATNVLNLTKVENQTILTDTAVYNLSEQIRSSFLLLENKWTKKHIDFDLEFGEYLIEANEELLKQAWINLIDNAVKFTPDYGIVKIEITDDDNSVSVSVNNSGSEISAKNQKKIFNKFYQEDESHSVEGNGIGLAIIKKIVELHCGEVLVHSRDNMTNFTVILPKKVKR